MIVLSKHKLKLKHSVYVHLAVLSRSLTVKIYITESQALTLSCINKF